MIAKELQYLATDHEGNRLYRKGNYEVILVANTEYWVEQGEPEFEALRENFREK